MAGPAATIFLARARAMAVVVRGAMHKSAWASTKRLRELITELEEISLAITENDPRWNR